MKRKLLSLTLSLLLILQCAAISASAADVRVSSRLWELLFGSNASEAETLAIGGDIFGVRIYEEGCTVAEVRSRTDNVLRVGDRLVKINGEPVCSPEDVRTRVENSGGKALSMTLCRNGKPLTVEVVPQSEGGMYRLGVLLQEATAGIGTLTYYNPETGEFGGLGHGIYDGQSGGEIPHMIRGDVTGAILGGVVRGEAGKPGELRGVLSQKVIGTLDKNNECGVFGKLTLPPPHADRVLKVADDSELHEGHATIRSCIKNGDVEEYEVEIFDIRENADTKSFSLHVTDEALLAMTGGIVRGMSGSPIIQDGKLVGAVTHVTVADPTVGYGIRISQMLRAAS